MRFHSAHSIKAEDTLYVSNICAIRKEAHANIEKQGNKFPTVDIGITV